MSSMKALFGWGGGSGVPIGMHVVGHASLPNIVVDGTTTYIKTGVVASSISYPLFPSVTLGVGGRYIASEVPYNAAMADKNQVARNGATVLAFSRPGLAGASYMRSTDGGANFVAVSSPGGANAIYRDCIFAVGYFYLLLRTGTGYGAGQKLGIWRSATGAAGSWVEIYTVDNSVVSSYSESTGLAYGGGRLVMVTTVYSNGTRTTHVVHCSVDATVTTPVFTTRTQNFGDYAQQTRVRYGKALSTGGLTFAVFGADGTVYIAGSHPTMDVWRSFTRVTDYPASTGNYTFESTGSVFFVHSNYTMVYANGLDVAVTATHTGNGGISGALFDGEYIISLGNGNPRIGVFDAAGTLLNEGAFPADYSTAAGFVGGSSYNGVVNVWGAGSNVASKVNAKSLPAGNYTNTGTAWFEPQFNASNQFQGSLPKYVRIG